MSEAFDSTQIGLTLEDRVARSRHEAAGIAIWYLGQVGFLFQHRGVTIAVDPYLSHSVDNLEGFPPKYWVRNYPPPFSPEKLNCIDLVLCTHDHLDHTDPQTLLAIAAASPQCQFAGPKISVEEMRRAGIPEKRTIILNDSQAFCFKGVIIEPIATAHEKYEFDREGFSRFLAYFLRWDGVNLFHAGDTMATPHLSERLANETINVGFLPINGADDVRRKAGVVGNMDAAAAVAFAVQHHFDLVVPTHYDLYPNNGAEIGEFIRELDLASSPTVRLKTFLPGERLLYAKADRRSELAVIIGAGKTGRGFLARLLGDSPFEICFVDISEELVQRLNEDGAYHIHFFGGERKPYSLSGVSAALLGSEQAFDWMSRASVIFTAVGEQNIPGLIPPLREVLDRRKKLGSPKLSLLVCENGASPAKPLRAYFGASDSQVEITEAAIFCSTIELPGTRLDIQSEPYDELPFDAKHLSDFATFGWMKNVPDFASLLQRKIYTYNCFSAGIAYLGALKGYQWYAEAARDPEIRTVLRRIVEPLNQAISKRFHVSIEEQRLFSEAALRKFSDTVIRDDIPRNARNVVRKLAPHDRLIAPASLILENGGDIKALALVMAAALLYRGPEEENLEKLLKQKSVADVFSQISECKPMSEINRRVVHFYGCLRSGGGLLEILDGTDSERTLCGA